VKAAGSNLYYVTSQKTNFYEIARYVILCVSCRTMLTAVESSATQSLRLTLTRQLAEVLLRGVSGTVYSCPEKPGDTAGQFEYSVLTELLL
jgi:hypothetical protein